MKRSRTSRRQSARGRRLKAIALGIGVAAVLAAGIIAAFAIGGDADPVEVPASVAQETSVQAESIESTTPLVTDSATGTVEVPDVVGRTVKEAQMIVSAAGLVLEIRAEGAPATSDSGEQIVQAQEPTAGELVSTGAVVSALVPALPAASTTASNRGIVVCIDPGHQSRSNLSPEPIGPGSSETKERVRGGATGVSTRIPEYEVVLQISTNLQQRLEAAGITVVMTRTTNDVDISNAERAKIANEAGADLFIRVHADGSTDQSVSGISTLYPGTNQWTGPIAQDSLAAAGLIQDSVVASTGATSRGTVARTDISGFNWATVPSVIVECGFMSNPVEDKLLSSPHYQDKLAQGIAEGVLSYVGRP